MAAHFVGKLLSVACAALLLTIAVVEGAPRTAMNTSHEEAADVVERETGYCSGYRPSNLGLVSSMEGCKTGGAIGVVDHMRAFGISSLTQSPNWTACGIPTLPREK